MNGGEQDNPQIQPPSSYGTPPPPEASGRVQWGTLFRLASPLAIVSGVISALLPPVGLLLALPLTLKRIITRYRPFHSGALRAGQSALMGAFTALLSFVAFLVFFLPVLSLRRGDIVAWLRDRAAQYPDPQQKEITLWFTTNEGFITYLGFSLVFLLVIFLIVGAISGAWISRPRKTKSNP